MRKAGNREPTGNQLRALTAAVVTARPFLSPDPKGVAQSAEFAAREGIIMASPSLEQTDFCPFEPAVSPAITTDLRSLYELTSSLDEAPFLTDEAGHKTISTADGLNGARAAIVAIAVEVIAALCLYGLWQLWQALR
jgi:hypothetical protein